MACTSGVWQNRRAVPASRGFQTWRSKLKSWLFYLLELSLQKGSESCFSAFFTALCSHPWSRLCSCCAGFPHGNVAEEKGGTGLEKGVGDSAKMGAAAAHPEPGCALGSKQPKWLHPWNHSPPDRLLWNSRVLRICLHEMNSCAAFAPSCGLPCTPGAFSAPLDAPKLQLLDGTQLELNPRIVLLSFHLPSFPFSTTLASKCFASTRYPKLLDKYALAGQFFLFSLLQENLVLSKG